MSWSAAKYEAAKGWVAQWTDEDLIDIRDGEWPSATTARYRELAILEIERRANAASVDPDAALDLAVDHQVDLELDPGHHPAPTCRECGQAVGALHRAECGQNRGAYLMP